MFAVPMHGDGSRAMPASALPLLRVEQGEKQSGWFVGPVVRLIETVPATCSPVALSTAATVAHHFPSLIWRFVI